jgi:cyclophilin family peptidyl-prolyl cis-trans isomerase/HEAT repeat protein
MKPFPILVLLLVPFMASAASNRPLLERVKTAELAREANHPALTEAIKDKDPAVRRALALSLGRIQQPGVIEPLKKLIDDTNSSVSREAVFALGQLGWVSTGTGGSEQVIAEYLLSLVKNRSSDAVLIIEAAGKHGLTKANDLFGSYLDDKRPAVRAAACIAIYRGRLNLQMRGTPAAELPGVSEANLKKMHALLKDSSPDVRRDCLYALVRSRAPVSAPEARALLVSRDFCTRFYALTALGRTGNTEADIIFKHLASVKRSEWRERLAALDALKEAKGAGLLASSEKMLSALAEDTSPHVRFALAAFIAQSEALPLSVAMELANDSSPTVRAAAITSLVSRMPAQAEKMLASKLAADHWIEREAVAQAAAKESAASKAAWSDRILLTLSKDPSILVRMAALSGLGKSTDAESTNVLLAALVADEVAVRSTAVEALASRPKDENTRISKAVREAILATGSSPKWDEFRSEAVKMLKDRGDKDPIEVPKSEVIISSHPLWKDAKPPRLTLTTTKGVIELELAGREAPHQVGAIVAEAKRGTYNGLIFHRVVPNFVVQGLDPEGSGGGYPGYVVRSEAHSGAFKRGSVGMPRSMDFDSGGVQIFINHVDTPHLEGQYTVIGKVVRGLEIVDKIERGDVIRKASVR